FNDILSIFYDLNFIYQQINKLPITITKRTYENDNENLSDIKHRKIESTTYLNQSQEQIIDDDDIIYIKTIQTKSTSTFDES
ncbi:unnamed protein product, partial [Rotaria sp. Silwood2]